MKIKAENNRFYGDVGWESDNDHFSEVAITSRQWLGSAGEHIYTAQLLLPVVAKQYEEVKNIIGRQCSVKVAPRVTDIFFFHCALSIENSLKGLIAVINKKEVKKNIAMISKVPNILIGHDLVELANRAGFHLDIDSEFALAFLTRYGVWGGKYPFATKNRDNALTVKLSDGNHYMAGGHNPEIVPSFLSFSHDIYSWASEKIEVAAVETTAGS
ncbi:hypothetical protein [Marinobacter maritimus]|uniref:hypothetical protein n=1 Tax=Marinobacter maritimus TaxID=277961 RepID=UPI0011AAF13D|nr:hypothetical protein [Marinobacter maritimus]